MWIITRGAFLSIVDKDCGPNDLLVRARRAGDIEQLFPNATVIEGAGTDYRFRAVVSRALIATALSHQVADIDYSNFKSEVARHDRRLEGVLHRVWSALLALAPGGRMG